MVYGEAVAAAAGRAGATARRAGARRPLRRRTSPTAARRRSKARSSWRASTPAERAASRSPAAITATRWARCRCATTHVTAGPSNRCSATSSFCPSATSPSSTRIDDIGGGRRDRADPGRRRSAGSGGGVSARPARALRCRGRALDLRRGDDRSRAHRSMVRLPAVGRPPRRSRARQSARRRAAAGRVRRLGGIMQTLSHDPPSRTSRRSAVIRCRARRDGRPRFRRARGLTAACRSARRALARAAVVAHWSGAARGARSRSAASASSSRRRR